MGALRATIRGLGFAKIAILARLLTPEKFGVFGIASLTLTFLETITESGINIFLIQEKEDIKKYINSAYAVSVVRGILIGIVMILFAPVIATFFDSPEVVQLLYLTGLIPIIKGFINPAIVSYQKDLDFGKEFYIRTFLYLVDALVAVLVAFQTKSAISLVWGLLAGSMAEVIFSHLLISPKPKIHFDKVKIGKVINRGKWITLARIMDYFFREGDDIVVGKLLNTGSLGLYQLAYKVSTLPITEVTDVVIKVTFPVFSKIAGDKGRLKNAFFKSSTAIFVTVIPFSLGIFYFSDFIVNILLGTGWEEAVPILRVLSVFGAIKAITAASYPLLLSLKKQKYLSVITLFAILGLAATIIPFVTTYGVIGAAYSAVFGSLLGFPVAIYFVVKVLK